ncbi:hypothetical protein EYC84_000371 [Monilinia fructicola]|uniref:Uncharacterized protein n=1 Tax=Monilinia fructicola TaxID=38448 RepID=A0A5M9JT76_MONFR|nr:hypothetical protein EYC84_000371 [Monilinia fructicola]
MAALIQLNCINTITNPHLVTATLFEQLSVYFHLRTRQNGFLLSNRWKASWLPLPSNGGSRFTGWRHEEKYIKDFMASIEGSKNGNNADSAKKDAGR